MYPDGNTRSRAPLGSALQPDAIDHLLEAALAGQPVTPVLIRSDGIVDTRAGQPHAWLQCAYLGPTPIRLPLTAAPLAPLNGYQFNFVGFRIDPALPHDEGPWWQLELQGGRGLVVRFFRQSLRWQHSSVWGSRLSLPNVPPLDLLSGLEQPHTRTDRERAWQGLRKLTEHIARRSGGRPSDFDTPEEARATLTSLVQAIRRAGQVPTEERVAQYLDEHRVREGREQPCDARQLRRYLSQFWPGTWDAWIAQLPPD
jgi:hypothetical protein